MQKASVNSKEFYKMLAALVLPMALQNLINVAVTSADVIMLGAVSETVLSAGSLASQVQFILSLFIFGVTSGASVLCAQYWGKGDRVTIEKVLGISLRFSLIFSCLFTAVAMLFPTPIMRIFTNDETIIAEGVKYLQYVSVSYIFMAVSTTFLNAMRSVERVVVSTLTFLASLVLNIIVNGLLIFGLFGLPELGIIGAALGTVAARGLEVVISVIYSFKNGIIRIRVPYIFKTEGWLLRDFLKYALPVTANEFLWGMAMTVTPIIVGHMDNSVVAANSVAQVVRQLSMVIGFGLASATAIILGKEIGAGETERAKRDAKRLLRVTLIAGICSGLLILAIRPFVIAAFTITPQAAEHLKMMLLIMSYYVVCQSVNTTLVVGVFRSGGDTKFGLVVDVITMWPCSLLWGALAAFVFHWSVPIVYLFLTCDELLKLPFTLPRYKKMVWLKNVTREQ